MDLIDRNKASGRLRVLLVEDSAEDEELLRHELVAQGYTPEIERVETAAELRRALEQSWDILLCDHALPRFDAVAALRIAQERAGELPFIIVSSAIQEQTAIEVMRAGARDFLLKHSLGRLGAVIERELEERRLRVERKEMQEQLLLSDRLVSVGTLAAGVAHEINNPLAYVVGNIDFALDRLSTLAAASRQSDSDLSEVIHALQEAREGSERIRITTRDLKVFCRTHESTKAAVNVRRVMDSAINMAWNEIRHCARLTRNFDVVPSVIANENRLGQVFLNLLVNAAHAVREGNVADNEISVVISSRRDIVTVEVKDTGVGIAPEALSRLFEPFFTTKSKDTGTGLGLSICQSIIRDLGGTIVVESELGVGTAFRVALPATVAPESVRPPRAERASAGRGRILVVDDEQEVCHVIRRLLTPEHEVRTSVDPVEVLGWLAEGADFDVIFCDLMMPRVSGMEFFGRLSALRPALAERVVFLTGGAFNTRARDFLSEVSNRVVEKPFDVAVLYAIIAQAVDANAASSPFIQGFAATAAAETRSTPGLSR